MSDIYIYLSDYVITKSKLLNLWVLQDYGIDLPKPSYQVAKDVYSMHAFVTIIMAIITFLLGLIIWVCYKYSAGIKTLLKPYIIH